MNTLFVFTEPPLGPGASFDALCEARVRVQAQGQVVKVFLSGDAARCAPAGQDDARYGEVQRLLESVTRNGGQVGVCARCMDSRGIDPATLAPGLRSSSFYEFWEWTEWANEIVAF